MIIKGNGFGYFKNKIMLSSGHLHKYKCKILLGKVTLVRHRYINQNHKSKFHLDCVTLSSKFMGKALDKDPGHTGDIKSSFDLVPKINICRQN